MALTMHSITLASLLLILTTGPLSYAATVFPTYINETAAARSHHQLWARQDLDIPIVCSLNTRGQSPLADIFNHFGLIGNGDVKLAGNYPFPIAVRGQLSTFDTENINTDHPGTCAVDDTSDVYSYGLDNPGITDLGMTSVYGNVLLGNTSSTNVVPIGDNCTRYSTDRSVVDYDRVRTGLRAATRYLASLSPDLTIDSTGLVKSIGTPVNSHFRVFTVNTCFPSATSSTTCSSLPLSQLSTGDMFGRTPNAVWSGPTNPEVYEDAETIVINVPVPQSRSQFFFFTDPSQGFKNCKTIFNFYAVDSSGEFIESDIPFVLMAYQVSSTFEGFILAPDADSSSQYKKLAGKLFTNHFNDVAHMDDFSCDAKEYTACFPVQDYTETSSTSTDQSSTSETLDCTSATTTETVTTETTTTEASTTTTDYTTTTSTDDTTVASTTVTVTRSATSTIFTTTTSTFTTTYTSDQSTITAVITTTAPVFVPVENIWDDERGDQRHGDWDGRRQGDWEDRRYGNWEDDHEY